MKIRHSGLYRNSFSTMFALLFCIVLAGCVSTSNLVPGDLQLREDEAVFILGVRPNLKIQIWNGDDVGNEGWRLPEIQSAVMNHGPTDGYIVFKLPATKTGKSYGLGRVIDERGKTQVFELCRNALTPAFRLDAGSVVYAGDLIYEIEGNGVRFRLTVDENGVRDYINTNYPELSSRLVTKPAQVRRVTNGDCSPMTIIVPIVVS